MPILDRTKLPSELLIMSNWVAWKWDERDGKRTKVPVNPLSGGLAMANEANTWSLFGVAERRAMNDQLAGVGLELSNLGFVAYDFDHCINQDGSFRLPEVETWVALLDSWTYITPSGEGLRVIVRGVLPNGISGKRHGTTEVYSASRYVTVTDQLWANSQPVIEERQAVIDLLWDEMFPAPTVQTQTRYPMGNPWTSGTLSDDEAIEHLERFGNAQKFRDLMAGSWEQYYPSIATAGQGASEADAGLVGIISYVTQDDAQIERIMWRSGLARDKWHESNYLQRTIQTYKRYRTVFYTPPPPRFTRPQRPAPMSNPCPSAPPAPMSNPYPSGDACAARGSRAGNTVGDGARREGAMGRLCAAGRRAAR
jgi:putative DNA primase/helicase